MITATRRADSAAGDRFGTPADDVRVRRAVAALEGSADWPVVRAMRRSGDFPQVFAASAGKLVDGTQTDLAAAWGCDTPTG